MLLFISLQLLGPADVSNIIRMQLARMRPGVQIKPHTDLGARVTHSCCVLFCEAAWMLQPLCLTLTA